MAGGGGFVAAAPVTITYMFVNNLLTRLGSLRVRGIAGMSAKEKKGGIESGRNLPSEKKQAFLKECYEKEDHTRLRSHLKNAKYRERQKTGEFRMLTVMRDRILGAVPKPGGYYRRVCCHGYRSVNLRNDVCYIQTDTGFNCDRRSPKLLAIV